MPLYQKFNIMQYFALIGAQYRLKLLQVHMIKLSPPVV